MMKVCLFLALTVVAGAAALQDGAPVGEAAPEPYAYSYQTDSHGASEQRDAQGRVTGFYTLTDADGRERRVEYVADEAGFRAKVATNEVGTKSENPANVEIVAAEPTPAQYSAQYSAQTYQAPAPVQTAQYSAQTYQAPAPVQTAQYVRQQTVQTVPQANYARVGYSQQYAYKPATYGQSTGYYYGAPGANYNAAYGSNYNAAYGGYGASYTGVPAAGYGYGASYYGAPAGGYVSGYNPGSQYYSYRSSSVGAAPVATYSTTGSTGGYRYVSQPAGGVTTSYRSVSVPVGGVSTYSAGFPAGVSGYSVGGPVGVNSAATRTANYQGSSNYLVLQKRAAEKEEKATSSS